MHARNANAKDLCKSFRCWCAATPTTFHTLPLHLHHAHPRFSINIFVSFGGSPLTPKALTCVPLLSLCNPIATFHPSLCESTKTYFFPSWSRMLARRTCKPIISPLCVTVSSVPELVLESGKKQLLLWRVCDRNNMKARSQNTAFRNNC